MQQGSTLPPPEQELAVQVGHIDGVHVNHVDAAKPAQRQVLRSDLATNAAQAFDGNSTGISFGTRAQWSHADDAKPHESQVL